MTNQLLQQFEETVTGTDGETYRAFVYGQPRPGSTWEGWLVFERLRDHRRFATGTETTQPDADSIVYWATGLTSAYFDGALERALRPVTPLPGTMAPPPLVEGGVDSSIRAARRATLERDILKVIHDQRDARILTQQLFDTLPYANADVVRALEAMEKQHRWIARRTEKGNGWLLLTDAGLRAAGLDDVKHEHGFVIVEPAKPRT